MKNCCRLHSNGKFKHWACSDDPYDATKRMRLKSRKKCLTCDRLVNFVSKKCHACYWKSIIGIKRKAHSKSTLLKLSKTKLGKLNPQWRGNQVGYSGLHLWIQKRMLKKICEHCGSKNNLQCANKSGHYKRNLKDWLCLCVSCHRRYDMTIKNKRFVPINGQMIAKI